MNIYALLAGLFSGIIGSMGLGGGAVLIIYLTLFTETKQLTAQGINLIFFIPIALEAVIIYSIKKKIKWKTTLKIAGFGLIGTAIGFVFAEFLGANLLAKVFGGLVLLLGIKEILGKKSKSVAERENRCYTKNE